MEPVTAVLGSITGVTAIGQLISSTRNLCKQVKNLHQEVHHLKQSYENKAIVINIFNLDSLCENESTFQLREIHKQHVEHVRRSLADLTTLDHLLQHSNFFSLVFKLRRNLKTCRHLSTKLHDLEQWVSQLPSLLFPSVNLLSRSNFRPYFFRHTDREKALNMDDQNSYEGKVTKHVLNPSLKVIYIQGIAAVGKSTVLYALSCHPPIIQTFHHGIYLISLGMYATAAKLVHQLRIIVTQSGAIPESILPQNISDVEEIIHRTACWFSGKSCLFLVDDVWPQSDVNIDFFSSLSPLLGESSKLVFTTRYTNTPSFGNTFVMQAREPLGLDSWKILMTYAEDDEQNIETSNLTPLVNELLTTCAGLPACLAIVGKAINNTTVITGCSKQEAWKHFREILSSSRDHIITDVDNYPCLSKTSKAAIELMDEHKHTTLSFETIYTFAEMFRSLCVLQKQKSAPLFMLQNLWHLEDKNQADKISVAFQCSGLVDRYFHPSHDCMLRIHDVLQECACLNSDMAEKQVWHEHLLNRYSCIDGTPIARDSRRREWWELQNDGYIYSNLHHHLTQSGKGDELVDLLLSPQWILKQLEVSGILKLEQELKSATHHVNGNGHSSHNNSIANDLQPIIGATRLSSAQILKNPRELNFQFQARLLRLYNSNAKRLGCAQFLERSAELSENPSLQPINQFLVAPGGPLLSIIHCDTQIWSICFLQGEARVACGTVCGRLLIVDIQTEKIVKRKKAHEKKVMSIASTPDGKRILSGSLDGSIYIWKEPEEDNDGMLLSPNNGHVWCVSAAPDNKRFLCAFENRIVQVRDLSSGIILSTFQNHHGAVYCAKFLGDGVKCISAGTDKVLRVWNAATGNEVAEPLSGHSDKVTCLSSTREGTLVVSGSDDWTMRIWDVRNGKEIKSIDRHSGRTSCAWLSEDGERLFSGSHDGTIRARNVKRNVNICNQVSSDYSRFVTGMVFTKKEDKMVSCSDDGTIKVWNIMGLPGSDSSGSQEYIYCVKLTPDQTQVLTGSLEGYIHVWDIASGKQVGKAMLAHKQAVRDIAVTPNGMRVVSVSNDKTVSLWDIQEQKHIYTFIGHEELVCCVAINGDGTRAVTGSKDETIRIWNLRDCKKKAKILKGHFNWVKQLVFTDDGAHVISASLAEIRCWDINTKHCLTIIQAERPYLKPHDVLRTFSSGNGAEVTKVQKVQYKGRNIYHQDQDGVVHIGTMDSDVWSWVHSEKLNTICTSLVGGSLAFMKVGDGRGDSILHDA